VKERIVPYCQELMELQGENLLGICVYGSSTGKDFIPKKSNVNLLVVLKVLGAQELKKSLRLVNKGMKKGIVAPLFLTPEYITSSLDSFPIEFMEIKENHILIYGENPLAQISIEREGIRLECEKELKGKLVRLRQAYLEIGLKAKGIEALLIESLSSLIPIFRNMLRLKGIDPPLGKEEVISSFASEFDIDRDVFLAVLRDKKGDERIGKEKVEDFFAKYIGTIQKLSRVVDQMS
jgi:hypothetical protein